MNGQLLVATIVVVLAGIIVLALIKKDSVEATLKAMGIEFTVKARGKLDEKLQSEQARIEALIRQHNADYVQAVNQRQPQLLWATSTPDACFAHIDVIKSMKNAGIEQIRLRDLTFEGVELLGLTGARVITHETWDYIYANGQTQTVKALNSYTLTKSRGIWQVARCDVMSQ